MPNEAKSKRRLDTSVSTLLALGGMDAAVKRIGTYSQRAKRVLAHTSFLHIHVITTLVLPCTAPAGQALDSDEGTTFNSLNK